MDLTYNDLLASLHVIITSDKVGSGESVLKNLIDATCLKAGHEAVEKVDCPKCYPETQVAFINDIMSWVNSSNPKEKIMWMKGPVGAGKSSIAQSVAQRCKQERKLISSFLFSWTARNRRDNGDRLVPTIAYQLMITVLTIKKLLLEEFEHDPAILAYTQMEHQFQRLVMQPLLKILAIYRNSKYHT
ncbi:hypothetical protein BDQ17DRAFT_1435096 [Cyathus striatus]|nr:hypothetical protein BDQ17DRAFT_1435096 [Cyathus striatus]